MDKKAAAAACPERAPAVEDEQEAAETEAPATFGRL